MGMDDEGICSKIGGDDLKEEDINPDLRGSMPEISDDGDKGHMDAGDAPSPEEATNDRTPESYENT